MVRDVLGVPVSENFLACAPTMSDPIVGKVGGGRGGGGRGGEGRGGGGGGGRGRGGGGGRVRQTEKMELENHALEGEPATPTPLLLAQTPTDSCQ